MHGKLEKIEGLTRMREIKLLNTALFIALVGSAALMAPADADPIVQVTGGEIKGRMIPGGGATFKGVPFAQPPVGDLRWRDPTPVKPWTGVRDAGAFGPACTQRNANRRPELEGNQEDCLYLNVWTSEWPAASRKPVMVWLYGGSNVDGSGSADYSDGTSLSRKGVVVVTINFRLGIFGFFAHPALTAESPHHSSGNYGLLDQLATLKWVHDNIARFGGDPGAVTLFGQSSGAIDTSYLAASPLSKGLIHRAIQESGPPVRPMEPLAEAEPLGVKFAESMQAPAGAAEAVKFLRSLSGPDLEKAALAKVGNSPVPLERPLVDGYVIPGYMALRYRDGQDLPIPMMIGSNSRETTRNYKPDVMRKWLTDNYGSLAPKAEEFYGWANGATGYDDPFLGSSATQIRADVRDRCPAIAEGVWRSSHGRATYEYMFDLPIPGESATRHGAEIPYVFGNFISGGEFGGTATDADRKISDVVQSYWVNFASTGNPQGKGLPEWPKFNAAARPYLEFTVHDGPVARKNLRRDICDLYIEALKETIPANTAGDYPEP